MITKFGLCIKHSTVQNIIEKVGEDLLENLTILFICFGIYSMEMNIMMEMERNKLQ